MFSRLLPTVLCLGQVFNFAYALPAAKRDITDEWTLRGFHWNCSDDGSICIYGFSIAEEMMGTPQQTPTFCHFMIRGGEHQSAVRSAFLDVPCEELESYRCTGSWSSTGYMVLTVDNVEDNTRAYFGFKDDELNDGQFSDIRRSPAYSVVPSAPSAIVMPSEILPRDDGGGDASVGSDDTSYSVVVTEDADGNLILQEISTADQLADAGNNDAASELMQAGIETPIDGNDLADVLNISPGIDGPTVDALATEVEDVNGPVLPTGVQGDNSSSKADDEPLAGTPPDVPVDAPSATADSLPNTASEQPTSPLSSENAKVADAQSGSELLGNVTNSLSSGPANGSGKSSGKTYLPAVPGTPATWGLRNITRGTCL